MATRSRLGRDPLQGAAKPAAKQPARQQRKSPARAKAAPQPSAVDQNAPPAAVATDVPQLPLAPAPDTAATKDQSETAMPDAAGLAGTPLDDAIFGEAALAKDTTGLVAPKAESGEPTPARRECAKATPETPADQPVADAAQAAARPPDEVPGPARPAPVALEQGAHPVEVFLRGVLEGLLPEGEAVLRVEVDPETFALPVEKLFYFSHALQRIVTPLEHLPGPEWRPGELAGPLPVLTVRLRAHSANRHMLSLTDNGLFFRSRLPELRLGMEALKPLVAFIVKRQGSVRLARGRSITFEIIG